MEDKLEQLLNMLIQRGWKPWGKEVVESPLHDQGFNDIEYKYEKTSFYTGLKHITDDGEEKELKCYNEYKLRELVSKKSGLWQFICANKLENPKERKQWTDLDEDGREYVKYSTKFYEFRLIESALKDESELESFILDNIKIGN